MSRSHGFRCTVSRAVAVDSHFRSLAGPTGLTRTAGLGSFNDKEVKPVNVDLHIGMRPLFVMDNVRFHLTIHGFSLAEPSCFGRCNNAVVEIPYCRFNARNYTA
jgi:hypothetical protein